MISFLVTNMIKITVKTLHAATSIFIAFVESFNMTESLIPGFNSRERGFACRAKLIAPIIINMET